ncbi:MAG: OmpA family protein [Bradymonadales bacterium]
MLSKKTIFMSKKTAVAGLLSVVAALMLASLGCVDANKLKAQTKQIKETAERIESPAYRCAPKEFALGKAHGEFGSMELGDGNGRRAEDHVVFGYAHMQDAERISSHPACQDGALKDRDQDGIIDSEDLCPDVPGVAEYKGCPDPDPDKDSVCSIWVSEAGLIGSFDCQGMDHCPDTPGELAYSGCSNPDTDSDGICDPWVEKLGFLEKFPGCSGSDLCPTVRGVPEFKGCPNPDPDRDGVCDPWVSEMNMLGQLSDCQGSDKCPFEKGVLEEDGCPPPNKYLVVTEDRIELKEQVFFATNKTKVLKQSEPLLDEIAKVLKNNPTIHIRVEGHTDSSGRHRNNVKLSQGRAKSVVSELIKRGIEKGRMVSEGFGPDRPIDTNDTPEGKANNRRVEIHITSR